MSHLQDLRISQQCCWRERSVGWMPCCRGIAMPSSSVSNSPRKQDYLTVKLKALQSFVYAQQHSITS